MIYRTFFSFVRSADVCIIVSVSSLDALDDFDKFQSSSVDPADHEKSQANTVTSQETDQSGNPEVTGCPRVRWMGDMIVILYLDLQRS